MKSEHKSEPKSSVKSEHKSSIGYSHSGMAQPVLPLSRSASAISHGTVKSESSSSKRGYGMAQPVGIVSGNASVRSESRSSKTRRSDMAQPVLPGNESGRSTPKLLRDSSSGSQYTVRSGRTASNSQSRTPRAQTINSSVSSRK